MSSGGGDVSSSEGAGGDICTYGAEGGEGKGGADGYRSPMRNDEVEGGESGDAKCVGEVERCARVGDDGVKGTALMDVERSRRCSISAAGES